MSDKPIVYKILEKDNLFFFISILVFISAFTQIFNDTRIATDHFLVGMVFLIAAFTIRSYKDTDVEAQEIEKKRPAYY